MYIYIYIYIYLYISIHIYLSITYNCIVYKQDKTDSHLTCIREVPLFT